MTDLIERSQRVLQSLTADQREALAEMDREDKPGAVSRRVLGIVLRNEVDVAAAREIVELIPARRRREMAEPPAEAPAQREE